MSEGCVDNQSNHRGDRYLLYQTVNTTQSIILGLRRILQSNMYSDSVFHSNRAPSPILRHVTYHMHIVSFTHLRPDSHPVISRKGRGIIHENRFLPPRATFCHTICLPLPPRWYHTSNTTITETRQKISRPKKVHFSSISREKTMARGSISVAAP